MAFLPFVVWGLAKVNEGECQQYLLAVCNCRIMISKLKQEISCWYK